MATQQDAGLDELVSFAESLSQKSAPLPRLNLERGERWEPQDAAEFEKENEFLADLFHKDESTLVDKFSAGFGEGVAQLAKAPDFALKALEKLGVSDGTIRRHAPFIARMHEFGKQLEEGAAIVDPGTDTDFFSQLARGAGSASSFAIAGGVGGLAGAAGRTAAIMLSGAAQTAIPMYEDILEETGSEEKAWAGAVAGART